MGRRRGGGGSSPPLAPTGAEMKPLGQGAKRGRALARLFRRSVLWAGASFASPPPPPAGGVPPLRSLRWAGFAPKGRSPPAGGALRGREFRMKFGLVPPPQGVDLPKPKGVDARKFERGARSWGVEVENETSGGGVGN